MDYVLFLKFSVVLIVVHYCTYKLEGIVHNYCANSTSSTNTITTNTTNTTNTASTKH